MRERFPHSPLFRKRVQGFSLLQMLVCIALVAILAVLTFAGSKSAFEISRKIKCVNNLRQIGACLHVYASDHNGNLPGFGANRMTTSFGPGNIAHRNLIEGKYTATTEIFFCPSDNIRRPTRDASGWARNPEQGSSANASSGYMHFYHRPGSLVPDNISADVFPRFRNIHEAKAIVTSCQWAYGPFSDFHKDGGINVLRLGGAVEWIPKSRFTNTNGWRLYHQLELE